jgi:hypothetical protein
VHVDVGTTGDLYVEPTQAGRQSEEHQVALMRRQLCQTPLHFRRCEQAHAPLRVLVEPDLRHPVDPCPVERRLSQDRADQRQQAIGIGGARLLGLDLPDADNRLPIDLRQRLAAQALL